MKRSISAVPMMTLVLTAIVVLLAALPAAAQLMGERPCAEDMAKFCGNVTPGGGRLLQCYEVQKMNMTRACVGWAELLKLNFTDMKEGCSKDIDARCSGSKDDPLEMLNCLQSNYIDLSPTCVKKLNQFKYFYPKPVQESGSGR